MAYLLANARFTLIGKVLNFIANRELDSDYSNSVNLN